MSSGVRSPGRADIEERTLRQDRWWLYPAVTFTVFTAFVVYATWRAFAGHDYYSSPYLSPFYSPCLATYCVEGSSDFGQPFSWWQLSPALIILIFPLGLPDELLLLPQGLLPLVLAEPAGLRRSPSRTASTPARRRLPLILNNVHRYFFYAAVVVALVLTFDAVLAFRDENGDWGHMGLGTLFFLVNVVLIWGYTLGCHSCRHAVGGRLRHFSKHPVRYRAWTFVSKLNAKHARYAWLSLFSVAFADLYVYLLATGAISDLRFF